MKGKESTESIGGETYQLSIPTMTRRRWRLLLFYCDHTFLSYEVWRSEGEGELLVV